MTEHNHHIAVRTQRAGACNRQRNRACALLLEPESLVLQIWVIKHLDFRTPFPRKLEAKVMTYACAEWVCVLNYSSQKSLQSTNYLSAECGSEMRSGPVPMAWVSAVK